MPTHARRVNAMTADAIDYVLHYFSARFAPRRGERGWLPSVSLAEVDAGQVDVVLALLRTAEPHLVSQAEWLVGHRIHRCPAGLRVLAPMPPRELPDERAPDERRVSFVCTANPRQGAAALRFAMLRVGMSLQQFYVRGGTRRDARVAIEQGWMRVS